MEIAQTFVRWVKQTILRWYEGPPIPQDPDFICVLGRYRRHWSSRLAHAVVEFYLKEWKWLLPFLVLLFGTMVAAVLGIMNLRNSSP